VKTRWAWLAINLCTAFIASRVIDGFEHTISQLVALASLMPIVAGIGGHRKPDHHHDRSRAGAGKHSARQFRLSDLQEMGVALINGLVWGGIMGGITWWLYDDMAGRRDDAGDGAEPAGGIDDGRDYPADDDQTGARPRWGRA
jgi:magnesium transporter